MIEWFSNEYDGGTVLVCACRGPSERDIEGDEAMINSLNEIDWNNL